ncbi:MAG: esterase [Acidimicrobiales bacterium]|nr:MAG: esterase [Acidimicrobiales bacterium]
MPDVANDRRLDPRLRAMLGAFPEMTPTDAASWEEIVENAAASGMGALISQMMDANDTEEIAPSAGLRVTEHEFTSSPDGNTIKLRFVRPDNDEVVPGIYYIHGGGMASMSAYDGNYRAWARIIAANGVAVTMVDFRNSVSPSSAPEVVQYPGGLNDCVSGFHWVHEHAAELGIDTSRLVVAGESGGGNLAIATTMRLKASDDLDKVHGLYALCPYISGEWPRDEFPSSTDNDGYLLSLHSNQGRMGYGIEAFEAKDPMAWPSFATVAEVEGFPKTMVSVNELDPLRDEGIEFYRLAMEAGVPARCRQVMGTSHGAEIFPMVCTEISRDTARDLAAFATEA